MRKGEIMSDIQKEKIRRNRKGKGVGNTNGFKKGQTSPNKGKKFSSEWIAKLSLSKKGKPSPKKGTRLSELQKGKITKALLGKEHGVQRREANRLGQLGRYLKIDPNYKVKGRNKRIAENGGFHSEGEWENLKAQYNWRCPSCGKQEPEIRLTRDHVRPLLLGGSNNIENIQPLCGSCNRKKHTQTIKY